MRRDTITAIVYSIGGFDIEGFDIEACDTILADSIRVFDIVEIIV